jgi:hypothetical protein
MSILEEVAAKAFVPVLRLWKSSTRTVMKRYFLSGRVEKFQRGSQIAG